MLSFLDVDAVDSLHPAIAAVIALALLGMLLAGIGGMAAFFRGRTRSAARRPPTKPFKVSATDYEAVPAVAPGRTEGHFGTVVMKFGGTSVADPDKIKDVARRLVEARERGNRVVGVLSAMGSTTDELIALAGRSRRSRIRASSTC